MYPGFDLTDIPARNDQSQLAALTASGIKIQSHIDTFINIRNDLFTDARKFGKTDLIEKGQLKGKNGLKLSIGDIVLINPEGKYSQGRFGVVRKLISQHTAEVETRERGAELIAIVNLFALVQSP